MAVLKMKTSAPGELIPLPVHLGRGVIFDSILDTVGSTPLVRLSFLPDGSEPQADVVLKLEYFNPFSSVKDRIGAAMIEAAEASGALKPHGVIVEATSGNTGIGLAYAAAVKGYRCILVMPETVSEERKLMLRYIGAEVVLTPVEIGVAGAIEQAREIAKKIPGGWMADQDKNDANFHAHFTRTASEIWNDTEGDVDALVAGVGTSGTLSGTGSALKIWKPSLKVFGVQPAKSPVLTEGDEASCPHRITGIGAFRPQFYDESLVDEVISIEDEDAIATARWCARSQGIPVGISSGAAVSAAIELSKRNDMKGKRIVVMCASGAERYLSTALFADVRPETDSPA